MDNDRRLLLRKGNIAYVAGSRHTWIPGLQRQKEGDLPEYSDSIVDVERALETFIQFNARQDQLHFTRSYLVAIALVLVGEDHWRSTELFRKVHPHIPGYATHTIRGATHDLLKQIKDMEKSYDR